MKNPLQNLLIFFSLCLCSLIAFQWHREMKLRQDVQTLTDTVQNKLEIIQDQQAAQERADEEIKRLDGLKIELTKTVKNNGTEVARLMKDLEKSGLEIEKSRQQIETYKGALQRANDNITKQNGSIETQNENLKKLSEEHRDLVTKYNKVVADFNDLAKKWNEAQTAAVTNAPSEK